MVEFQRDLAADKRYRKQGVRTFHLPEGSAVSNHSVWWGVDGVQLAEAKIRPSADLALCRLEPFDADSVPRFPVIKDPARGYSPGRSLCNLGFPLHRIEPLYNEETNTFTLPPGSVPLPMLPLDGMFMRVINKRAPEGADGETCAFIELSSPSLIGQMGGPVFDADAAVWGIQSHTVYYPLGFSPPIPGARQGQVAHQFLNTGLAVHAAVIRRFLDDEGIGYEGGGLTARGKSPAAFDRRGRVVSDGGLGQDDPGARQGSGHRTGRSAYAILMTPSQCRSGDDKVARTCRAWMYPMSSYVRLYQARRSTKRPDAPDRT